MTKTINPTPTPQQIRALSHQIKALLEGVIDECDAIELEPVHEALALSQLLSGLIEVESRRKSANV